MPLVSAPGRTDARSTDPARPRAPRPHPVGVAVRLVDLTVGAADVARAAADLTAAELARAHRGTAVVRRRRILLRSALRRALAAELDVLPARVPIATTAAGRPHVAGRPDLDANCSASAGLGLVVVARGRRVGIDVERLAPWSADVLDEGWLAESEREELQRLDPGARGGAATRCWTRKEAVLKARGRGLLDDPASVVTGVARPAATVPGWALHDVGVPRGWVASLAVGPVHEERA
jgi:4'-phosphopantetheinyl transferase